MLAGAVAALCLCGPAAAAAVPDTLEERVQPCTACHGREGRATNQGFLPRIAGKPAGYLFNQLRNFRDGRRENLRMAALVAHLDDAYLQEIAGHFAALDLPYPPPQPTALAADELARGRRLVLQGEAARGLPACAACHGTALTGVAPALPGLLGLPRDYLVGQLGAWRAGLRHAAAPDCMARIAERLSAADIAAIAGWLAAQPLPGQAHPVAALSAPLPIACGSVPAGPERPVAPGTPGPGGGARP